ncbi:hypothetical protein Sru01_21080 [Sphaerisporangium rufum]|uniref:Nbr1 FW domain-containing protein n=1 Tax=Sphaerisporangium rufum TaxID=1381558 RepID=A0A919UXL2_9ACTN|nr:NBR1-Ig-like domain-containing protein [Sphaerisporangium rufum]GII77126.1 hypothetical protein Sru01_21080 [Sphaerisporangium rufum]
MKDTPVPGRPGRRPARPDPDAGPAAAFADRLWDLKERAGDPSFAEMAGRLGAAASKSSLAAAARGQVLPSWETTWEFVRVLAAGRLGQDAEEVEREWRARWEAARDALRPPDQAGTATGRDGAAGEPARRPRRVAAIAAAAAALAGGTAAVLVATSRPDTPAGPPTPPARDDSTFERDVTYPDGSEVAAGGMFVKKWLIRNTGTTRWRQRFLTRVARGGDGPCTAPERVPIATTEPGRSVEIAVPVRAGDRPGRCKIYWKMTDADGRPLLAGKNPIFLDVLVVGR